MRILPLTLAALVLAAPVLAGCSREAAAPAAPPAAKAPEFPPALIREYVAGIKIRCGSNNASGFAAGDAVRKAETPQAPSTGSPSAGSVPIRRPGGCAERAVAKTPPSG